MTASQKLNRNYLWIQGLFYLTNAALGAFGTVFMLDRGINEATIGWVMSLANVLSLVFQALLVNAYEGNDRLTLKSLIRLVALVIMGLAASLFVLQGPWLTSILFTIIWALVIALIPQLNSIFVNYKNLGYAISFNQPRAFGSLSYSLTALFLGRILVAWGYHWLLFIVLAAYLLIFLLVGLLPGQTAIGPIQKERRKAKAHYLAEDPKSKVNYRFVLAGVFLFLIFHNMITTYMIHVVQPFGGNEAQVGVAMAISAGIEVPVLLGYSFLARRHSHRSLLFLSGIGFFIKVIVTAFSTGMLGIYFAQFLQIIAFAIYVVAIVEYTNEILSPKDAVRGQTYISMASTAGGIVGNIAGGYLVEYLGLTVFFAFGLLTSTLGVLCFVLGLRRNRESVVMK